MSKPVVKPIGPALNIAKGAHWDNRTGILYFVDMFKGTVHSYNPKNQSFKTANVGKSCEPQPMAIIIPTEGGTEEFVISWKNDLSKITWNGVSCTTSEPEVVQNLESNTSTNRINNGKVDPMNRLWAGTTGKRLSEDELVFEKCKAAMYCLHEASTVDKILDKVSVSNGMEWSCDKKTFYFADSAKFKLEAYDYCNDSAKICNPRTILDLKKNKVCGVLDGIAMDSDGKLYITNYMGCQVIVFDPKCNKICNKIKIPAEEVTSVCWGGPSYDLLYVTTGNTKPNKKCPQAGRLFEICGLGVRGVPCRNASL